LTRLRSRLRIREIGVLTILALIGYLRVAVWLRDDLHFFVNDALARTSDAIFVTVGRDPHLGAIGFFWPPLPQLIQCPFVPFLEPFGRADMAGPISSALCMALTIPVLGKLCTRLGLSRALRFGICASFAINPVMIYYAANGMSEACSILFIAIAMLGFLTFIQTRSTPDLIILVVGLSGAILTRLEAPFLSIVLAIIAGFEWRRWRQSLWTTALIILPPALCFGTWMVAQWALVGAPTFFIKQGAAGPGQHVIWLPNVTAHPLLAFSWALHWALVLGPALFLAVGFLVWHPNSATIRGTIGILAGAAVFLVLQIYELLTDTGWGNPRYFVTCIVFATVAAAWLASKQPTIAAQSWNLALIGVLLAGGVTGSRSLASGRVTHVERECLFFDHGAANILPFLGKSYPSSSIDYCVGYGYALAPWQHLDTALDRMLKPSDRVLDDNFSNFYVNLYTRHPGQFIVQNDRDWQKIVANPIGTVNYIVTVTGIGTGGIDVLPGAGLDAGRAIIEQNPKAWKVVGAFPGAIDFALTNSTAEIYKYVGSPSAP
jgi:hypothetical protein